MVVTPQVEWATNTVQSPSENPWLAMVFWAWAVRSTISPSPWVSRVSSSYRACMRSLQGPAGTDGSVYGPASAGAQRGDEDTEDTEDAADEATEDAEGPPLPELADALMAPLLDAGGEVLRRLPPADLPPAARR